MPVPMRQAPNPSTEFGKDDPCFNCGKPGSTCQDCGAVICEECNKNVYVYGPEYKEHEPSAHIEDVPQRPEPERQRLMSQASTVRMTPKRQRVIAARIVAILEAARKIAEDESLWTPIEDDDDDEPEDITGGDE
jgi:hypothetical protein